MAYKDSLNELKFQNVIDPVAKDADTNGAAVDMAGYNSLLFVWQCGIGGITFDGSNYVRAKVQKSVDSAFTSPVDLTGAELYTNTGIVDATSVAVTYFGIVNAAADDDEAYEIGVVIDPDYRYYRIVLDFVGTHGTATPVAALAIKGHSNNQPETNLYNLT